MAKTNNSKAQGYEIVQDGAAEYVVVRCPRGHLLRGLKVGEMMARQEIACTECKAQWTVLAPMTSGMEPFHRW